MIRAGKIIPKSTLKRKKTGRGGFASFFSTDVMLKLLSSENSSLRFEKTLMKILSSACGCVRLNMPKPKNGFATNSKTAKQRYILADFSLCMFYNQVLVKFFLRKSQQNLFIIIIVTLLLQTYNQRLYIEMVFKTSVTFLHLFTAVSSACNISRYLSNSMGSFSSEKRVATAWQ